MEVKVADLLKEYQDIILNTVKNDPQSFSFILDLIKNYWLIYFYPKVYPKYILPAHKAFIEGIDPETVGYHPYCSPLVHVILYITNSGQSVTFY